MFFIIKKKVIVCILSIVLFLMGIMCITRISPASSFDIGKTIVIDAGHGGIDGGVIGENSQVKESEINLAISKCLEEFLVNAGYKVVMTRNTADSLKKGKLKDMEARRDIILKSSPDLVISIHQNNYPRSYVKGAQVFYAPNGKSKDIAIKMQDILNDKLGNNRNAAKGDYYILQCSPFASLLVECGFLSNPSEEALLVTPKYQQKVAYSIFCAVNHIFDIDRLMNDDIL